MFYEKITQTKYLVPEKKFTIHNFRNEFLKSFKCYTSWSIAVVISKHRLFISLYFG